MRAASPDERGLSIDGRYSGFPGVALGGYAAGILAHGLGAAAEVRFRRPVPLDTAITVRRGPGEATFVSGDTVLAEARPSDVTIEAVPTVGVDAARDAARRHLGREHHLFPRCFCCGPARALEDGLRVFVGPLSGSRVVAGTWTAPRAWAGASGDLRPEIAWSAVDCPGIWALIADAPRESDERVVTGTLAVHIVRPLRSDVCYVVAAWPLGRDGRRLFSGTAIFGLDGALAVVAKQTCVTTEAGVPLGLARWSRAAGGLAPPTG